MYSIILLINNLKIFPSNYKNIFDLYKGKDWQQFIKCYPNNILLWQNKQNILKLYLKSFVPKQKVYVNFSNDTNFIYTKVLHGEISINGNNIIKENQSFNINKPVTIISNDYSVILQLIETENVIHLPRSSL
jgi:hypothetical protein